MSENRQISGRCLCGAVSFSAQAKDAEINACHCGMCRRWVGGPYLAVEVEGTPDFTGQDDIAVYASSEWGERGFCRKCGTSLFWRMQDGTHYGVPAGTLDSTDGFRFTLQIFTDEKPAFYDFANKTKMMTGEEFLAAFSGDKDG